MKYVVNYSPPLGELLEGNELEAIPDALKMWPEFDGKKKKKFGNLVSEVKKLDLPLHYHFPFFVGRGIRQQLYDIDWIRSFLNESETTKVNVHIDANKEDVVNTNQSKQKQQVYNLIAKDLKIVVNDFGAENIIVENMPYNPDFSTHYLSSDPALIADLVNEFKVGLLLDIDHARMRSHYGNGEKLDEYVQKLPLDSIAELHMTGTRTLEPGGELYDHLSMKEQDWDILGWAFRNIRDQHWSRPEMFIFEYGAPGKKFEWKSDPEVLKEQIPKGIELMDEYRLRETT